MQVDRPGRRHRRVGILFRADNILFAQNKVAEKSTRFALARDVRDPVKLEILNLLRPFALHMILHIRPMSVSGAQTDIADTFHIRYLVVRHPRFPVPVAVNGGFDRPFVKLNRPREFRKTRLMPRVRRIPLNRRAHRQRVPFLRRARLVVFRLRFATHRPIRAR